MDKRILWACLAALGVMLAFGLLAQWFGTQLNHAVVTPLGAIPLFDLFGVLLAMAVGAVVARRRFRWIALAIMALSWALTIAVLAAITAPEARASAPSPSLLALLHFNAAAIVLTMAVAWLGALLGEHWLARRGRVEASR